MKQTRESKKLLDQSRLLKNQAKLIDNRVNELAETYLNASPLKAKRRY